MSNNILDLLSGSITPDVINQFSDRLGTDQQSTAHATQGAINILLSAMNKQAQQEQSRGGLFDALTKDHDGGILDDLMGYAAGTAQVNSRTANGEGILGHLLGKKKQKGAIEMLTQVSGLDKKNAGSLLAMLAPVVMGAVGKNMKNQNSGAGGLGDLLGSVLNSQRSNLQEQSMIERLLDQDNDGSVIDDLLNIGMKFLRRK